MQNITSSLSAAILLAFSYNVNADINFKGTLLAWPCQIDPASGSQDVVFLETTAQQFREAPGVGPLRKFDIKLINCHTNDVKKVVRLSFSGAEEPTLPGTLKVAGVNEGKLAIQIVDSDGTTLLKLDDINNDADGIVISSENIVLNFGAYVQATQKALSEKSVTPGEYSAIATFKLVYQ